MRYAGWVIALAIAGCGGGSTAHDDAAVQHDAALADVGDGLNAASLMPLTADVGLGGIGVATAPTTFTVANTGNTTLGSPTVGLTGANAAAFAIESTTCTAGLVGGASCTIAVQFKPLAAGPASANLTYAVTPGITLAATLDGTGASGTAALAISPVAIAFADTPAGQTSSTATVTVANNSPWDAGAITLTKGGMGPTQFSIVANTCTALGASQSCTFGVAFAPSALGATSATVQIASTQAGTATVALSGTGVGGGVITINPSLADFGSAGIGTTTAATTFTVANTGAQTTVPLAVALGGPAPGAFAIASDGCAGQAIAPGGTCTIAVTFSPLFHGLANASSPSPARTSRPPCWPGPASTARRSSSLRRATTSG